MLGDWDADVWVTRGESSGGWEERERTQADVNNHRTKTQTPSPVSHPKAIAAKEWSKAHRRRTNPSHSSLVFLALSTESIDFFCSRRLEGVVGCAYDVVAEGAFEKSKDLSVCIRVDVVELMRAVDEQEEGWRWRENLYKDLR